VVPRAWRGVGRGLGLTRGVMGRRSGEGGGREAGDGNGGGGGSGGGRGVGLWWWANLVVGNRRGWRGEDGGEMVGRQYRGGLVVYSLGVSGQRDLIYG